MNLRTVIFLFAAPLLLYSLGCAEDTFIVLNESPFTRRFGAFWELEECSKLYENNRIAIIEAHCDNKTRKDGIYIIHAEGQRHFDWFAPRFNTWAWNEGCNFDSDCYYKVKLDDAGEIMELEYHYFINLSEGFYKLEVENGELTVKEHYNKAIPS